MVTPHNGATESEQAIRVRALESILVEKGYIDPKAIDVLVDTYENRIGPRNGAKVVARAWVDPDYRARRVAYAMTATWANRVDQLERALAELPKRATAP